MGHRAIGFAWLMLAVIGCHSLVAVTGDASRTEAARLWSEGEQVLQAAKANPPAPIEEKTLALNTAAENHLTQAASQLEKGDEAGACAHLAEYLTVHPEHTAVRVHFAELLLRQRRTEAAREQFELFEVQSQEQHGIPLNQRIRCESRLAKIAEQEEDEYQERLHRGIGLFLLACDQLATRNPDAELSTESVLCRAANELREAHQLKPGEARPSWYLYQVWASLGQRQQALRRLKAADRASTFTYLSPTEHRDLQLACARRGSIRHP
jgi:hypothetical protein